MRVVLDGGTVVDLGKVEVMPTIGITDYSRRTTDDFGTTTIVPRNFRRRMSLRLAVPSERADTVYRQLTDLRATPAQFVADDRFAWLKARGIIKDFEFSFASGDTSFYTLSIDGLAEPSPVADLGIDPAPAGRGSTLSLIQPATIDDAALIASSVAENDAPAWVAGTTYAAGARVMRGHRVYESLTGSNTGADPAGDAASWLNTGPTNRWAMLDEALGTATTASGSIAVTLRASGATALALLDVNAAAIRVQADGYDRTQAVTQAAAIFTGLPEGDVTVTVAGSGTVSVGTLLIGRLVRLGQTEADASAGIIDYSRKETDDFGEVTIVERAWAKRMSVGSLIRSDAVDMVADRLAAVRARPALWIARQATDSLTIYGFVKDWSIPVGKAVSKLSLSIEGLSKAAPVVPASGGSVAWPDITDPDGTKPTDNADKTSENTSKDTAAVGGKPAGDVLEAIEEARDRYDDLVTVTIPAIEAAGAAAGQRITETRAAADLALSTIESEVERVDQRIDNLSASGGYDDTAVNARITDERELSLGRDAALGTRIDTVDASIQTTDTNLRALVQTKEQAAVSREDAIAKRIDDLIAEGGGGSEGVDTVARAEIQRVEQAAVLGQQALSSRTTTLESQASPSGGNLVPNSSLSTVDGWSLTFNPDGATTLVHNGAGEPWMIGGVESNLCLHRAAAGAGLCSEAQSADFAVRGGSTIQFYALTASHRCRAWVSVFFYNNAGAYIAYAGEFDGAAINRGGRDINEWDRTGTLAVTVPGDAVRARIVLRSYDVQNDGYAWFSRPFVTEVKAATKTWAPYSAGNDRPVSTAATARIKTTEDTLADLPNRYATAQRATNIEAAVGAAAGRIGTLERVTSDGTLVTSQRVDNIEASLNDSRATVSQQAGVIVGLGQKTAAYVRIIADAGNGRAGLSLWSDQYGGNWRLEGNGAIGGNLVVENTLSARAIDASSFTREGEINWSGYETPARGQIIRIPPSLTLAPVLPKGRFQFDLQVGLTTNAGQEIIDGSVNGTPVYRRYVATGGLAIFCVDNQGNRYNGYNPGGSNVAKIRAMTEFTPVFYIEISRGAQYTGTLEPGDGVYYRNYDADYTLYSVRLNATWLAI